MRRQDFLAPAGGVGCWPLAVRAQFIEERQMEVRHRTVTTNGTKMHIAEAGSGSLVIMCHGFPESWYSWRHQLVALAEAGFHAIAPDMRG